MLQAEERVAGQRMCKGDGESEVCAEDLLSIILSASALTPYKTTRAIHRGNRAIGETIR